MKNIKPNLYLASLKYRIKSLENLQVKIEKELEMLRIQLFKIEIEDFKQSHE